MIQRLIARMTVVAAAAITVAGAAQADLRVSFNEGAPKDSFLILNAGACAVSTASLRLDLSTSQGGLIFDVTAMGEGVEVFQPFELTEGTAALATVPAVQDGQDQLALDIDRLPPGQAIAFTIDVDDTTGQRAITVSGSEIEGAAVSLASAEAETQAVFSADATATLPVAGCNATSNG